MGQTKYTRIIKKFPGDLTKENTLEKTSETIKLLEDIIDLFQEDISTAEDQLSPVLKEKYSEIYGKMIEARDKVEFLSEHIRDFGEVMVEEDFRNINEDLFTILKAVVLLIAVKEKDFRIVEEKTDSGEVRKRVLQFKSEDQTDNKKTSKALQELTKVTGQKRSSQTRVSKDLWESQIHTSGDLSIIGSEKEKQLVQKLQKRGKLLFGGLEGLVGGSAYFKSFTIALAQVLNEQTKYYKTEGDWSGVPRELLHTLLGESVKIERPDNSSEEEGGVVEVKEIKDSVQISGTPRPFPYILVSYEDLAKKMSKTGKISGGKDIDFIRRYINGGYTKFETDPKTRKKTPVKSSFVPGLNSRKYFISNGNGKFISLPYIVNEGDIVDLSRKDPEVGCILRLSPTFSLSVRGYTGLRSDTIQLLGGGQQKDITMDLFALLVYNRGIPEGEYRVAKSKLLKRYENKGTYKKGGYIRKEKLETDFREAISKILGTKVITDYREKKTPGGVMSIFVFSKEEYLQGEDIPVDEQTGE